MLALSHLRHRCGGELGTLINLGGQNARGGDAFSGECHLWAATTPICDCLTRSQRWVNGEAARIVVDLGTSRSKASTHAAEFNPHILVLSHSDHDHVGGFGAFSARWPDQLLEVWVPYEWGLLEAAWNALQDNSPPHRHQDQHQVVHPESIRRMGLGTVEELPNARAVEGFPDESGPYYAEDSRQTGSPLGAAEIEGAIEEAIDSERHRNPDWPPTPRPEHSAGVARDVVGKARKLLRIINVARSHGARVRFFSTDVVRGHHRPWRESGTAGVATVINAVEVSMLASSFADAALSVYLTVRLTEQNRRALSTFLWDKSDGYHLADDQPLQWWDEHDALWDSHKPWGVLIWSDGAGESCRVGTVHIERDLVPWEHISIMTAPHHGSANAAHSRIWQAKDDFQELTQREIPVLLVGGTQTQQTAPQFQANPLALRGCTRCRHAGEKVSKTVVVTVDGPRVSITPHCRV